MCDFQLDTIWHAAENAMEFVLTNLTQEPLSGFRMFYGSLTRTASPSDCEGATLLRRQANYHEYGPPDGFILPPGGQWRFTERHLTRAALHSNDGPKSAGLIVGDDGAVRPVHCADLQGPQLEAPASSYVGQVALAPWPAEIEVGGWRSDRLFHIGLDQVASVEERRTAATVTALAHRLFPLMPSPFVMTAAEGVPQLHCNSDAGLGQDSYDIRFSGQDISLSYGPGSGLLYGLITLAQLLHGASNDATFAFPHEGRISDAPAFGWRGAHLDVSRQFYPLDDVLRFVDIMAWHKLNRFHWHLTDDEGWRLKIDAFPALTRIGGHTGLDYPILPQLGGDPNGHGGCYSQAQARQVVAHAAQLGIEVMPEIDIPGHCTCVLAALPHLVDPEEPESYWSVQGFANNALNPGIPATLEFIRTVLQEVCAIFPFEVIHIGGDEVAEGAWLASPQAQALMRREGLADTAALQGYLLGQVQEELTRLGRISGGWEEAAQAGGVKPANGLLFAWTLREQTARLARAGYDVVSTPGQTYYLDMAQGPDWYEPGASWAGHTDPETTYHYDALGDDPVLAERLVGVQACIWSEHLTSKARFNHMVFPRLTAIAEAGWTPYARKDFQRFAKIARLMPKL